MIVLLRGSPNVSTFYKIFQNFEILQKSDKNVSKTEGPAAGNGHFANAQVSGRLKFDIMTNSHMII